MSNDDRLRQVATTKEKYGEDHYKTIGSKGGQNSPTKFNTDSAKKAANARWDAHRQAKLKEEKEQ